MPTLDLDTPRRRLLGFLACAPPIYWLIAIVLAVLVFVGIHVGRGLP